MTDFSEITALLRITEFQVQEYDEILGYHSSPNISESKSCY